MAEPTYLPDDPATPDDVRKLIHWVLHKTNCTITISWSWGSNRMTARIGEANLRSNRIKLSPVLFPRASATKRRNTIIHEVCHLVANHRLLVAGRDEGPHGREWKKAMRECGEKPKARYTADEVDRDGLRKVWLYTCRVGCSANPHRLGKTRHARSSNGTATYSCRTCGITLTPTGAAPLAASTPGDSPKEQRKMTDKKKNAYQQSKEVSAAAHEIVGALKWAGSDGCKQAIQDTDETIRKKALRLATKSVADDEGLQFALNKIGEELFPEGLSQRSDSGPPRTLKARTTKQQPHPFLVVRCPQGFEAVRGSIFEVDVDEKTKTISLKMEG